MSPSTRVAALALQATQRSALLAHINSTASFTSNFSSSATTNDPSTSSLSSAIYLSASLRAKAAGSRKPVYENEDARTLTYMALNARRLPAEKSAAPSDVEPVAKDESMLTMKEVKGDKILR